MNIPSPLISEDAFVATERTELIHLCRKLERERDEWWADSDEILGDSKWAY